MSYRDLVQKACSIMDAIARKVREDVESKVSDVSKCDDELRAQMRDYNRTRDIDYRYEYERDLDELVGRREHCYEEVFTAIENGKDALCDLNSYLENVIEAVDKMEEDTDLLPEDVCWFIPRADDY